MRFNIFKAKKRDNLPLLLTIITVFIFFLGFLAGFYGRPSGDPLPEGTAADGWEKARQALEKSDHVAVISGAGDSISGTVKSTAAGKIIVSARLLNPLDPDYLKERTVIINDDTEITLRKKKTAAEIEAEKTAWAKKLEDLKNQLSRTAAGREIARTNAEIERLRSQIGALHNKIELLKKEEGVGDLILRISELEMEESLYSVGSYKEVSGEAKDIQAGFSIYIKAGEKISDKREFTASTIIVSEVDNEAGGGMAPLPPGPPAAPQPFMPPSPYEDVLP